MKIQDKAGLESLFAAQGERRWTVAATDAKTRIGKLRRLRAGIVERQDDLYAALYADYRKPQFEAWLTEVLPSIDEIDHTVKHLRSWMKDKRVPGAGILPGAKSYLRYEPKGRVLIMSPWNYPFQLLIAPLVSAIAAGNVIMAKPSNKTPATSAFIASFIESLFPPNEIAIVEGPGKCVGDMLLTLPFDHVFFTGSPAIGITVGEAASRMHAGLTLELGGKSPAIVIPGADIDDAARKIVWAKYLNAGQTCIAPDYLFCPRDSVQTFVEAAELAIEMSYGADEASRHASEDFPRIVDKAACARHKGLVDDAVRKGATVRIGGVFNTEERYAAPTILTGVSADMAIMADEIFGPILPIIAYDSIDEAIAFIQSRPKPLALYAFGKDKPTMRDILARTSSGSACVNDIIVQIENLNAPFGGIGQSGSGSYHGRFGFKTFSHERNYMRQGPVSLTAAFYPPYANPGKQRMRRLLSVLKGMINRH